MLQNSQKEKGIIKIPCRQENKMRVKACLFFTCKQQTNSFNVNSQTGFKYGFFVHVGSPHLYKINNMSWWCYKESQVYIILKEKNKRSKTRAHFCEPEITKYQNRILEFKDSLCSSHIYFNLSNVYDLKIIIIIEQYLRWNFRESWKWDAWIWREKN